jgi:hypothetical protein
MYKDTILNSEVRKKLEFENWNADEPDYTDGDRF